VSEHYAFPQQKSTDALSLAAKGKTITMDGTADTISHKISFIQKAKSKDMLLARISSNFFSLPQTTRKKA
jgi:hypothetical protein